MQMCHAGIGQTEILPSSLDALFLADPGPSAHGRTGLPSIDFKQGFTPLKHQFHPSSHHFKKFEKLPANPTCHAV